MINKFTKFQLEEMHHHDSFAKEYTERSELDYIWEIPAKTFLLKSPYIQPGQTVLDMGCGPSTPIKHILSTEMLKNISYIGVDISREMLHYAKKNIPYGKFIQDDMETVKVKKLSIDVLVSLGALHHSENKTKTLINWLNMVKPAGYILLREPTKDALPRGHGESPNEEGVNMDEIIKFATKNNVQIKSVTFFWSPVFHLMNKILIKLRLGEWRKFKCLWSIMLYIDVCIIKIIHPIHPSFNGDSIAIVLEKLN